MKCAQTINDIPISDVVKDTLYLAVCALRQEEPDAARVGRMELQKVYRMSKFHSIEAMTYMALEKMAYCPFVDSETGREWKKAKERAIRKTMLLDAERGQILAELERLGIWYMPLKGSILKDYYPRYGMRQMGDNDILYDTDRQEDVVTLMKERGYTVKCIDKNNQDDFLKLPVYNFEMHSVLYAKKSNAAWYAYYRGIKDRLLRDGQSQYGYRFTDEDFYLYMTAHAYKHYSVEGTGLRALTDTYAYLSKKEGTLDWRYVESEAKKLGIEAFEQNLRELSRKLFDKLSSFADVLLTPEEQTMLADLAGAGVYGTKEKYVERKKQEYRMGETQLNFWGKLRYLGRRLFPDMAWFEKREPFFARHKILIPFFLVYRMFRHILFHREWLKRELHILWGGKKKPQK